MWEKQKTVLQTMNLGKKSMNELILGIDFGTTNCKVIYFKGDDGKSYSQAFTTEVDDQSMLKLKVFYGGRDQRKETICNL